MGTGCQTLACSLRTFVNECGLALFGPVFAALAPFGTVPIECALVWYIGCCLFWALAALNSAARNSVRHMDKPPTHPCVPKRLSISSFDSSCFDIVTRLTAWLDAARVRVQVRNSKQQQLGHRIIPIPPISVSAPTTSHHHSSESTQCGLQQLLQGSLDRSLFRDVEVETAPAGSSVVGVPHRCVGVRVFSGPPRLATAWACLSHT